jgi:hypothetical protein
MPTTKIAMEFHKKNNLKIKGFARMSINDKINALKNDTDPATKFEWNKIMKEYKRPKGKVQTRGQLPVGKGLGIDKILESRKMKEDNKKKKRPRKKKIPDNKPSFKTVQDFFRDNFIDTDVEYRVNDRLYAEYDKKNPKNTNTKLRDEAVMGKMFNKELRKFYNEKVGQRHNNMLELEELFEKQFK